jgi:two-component system phosphate regulon response regulator PhoB
MPDTKHIVVVEDEADLAELVAYNLERAGYQVRVARDGEAALKLIDSAPPDLVVLDLMIPKVSGLEVARHIRTAPRTSGIPILMLTAKAEEVDQVAGLRAGADDYVTKPFSIKVLLARVEAVLRRTGNGTGETQAFAVGPVAVDLATHTATSGGEALTLTLTEFRILVALMRSKGRVLTREDLMYTAIGPSVMVTARTIDVHMAAIRKKLGRAGVLIRTVRGVGYMLSEEHLETAE